MKIAFLGCSDHQLPYLDAALNLSNEVIVFDRRPTEALRLRNCRIHAVSYSDVSSIIEILSRVGFESSDAVFTGAAHFAWDSVARIRAHFDQPGPSVEDVDLVLDKTKFYKALGDANIKVPAYRTIGPADSPPIDRARTYFMKSDYGKSPNYLFRVDQGQLPEIPDSFDNFYRSVFLLQDEIIGTHIRLNVVGGWSQAMLKVSDDVSLPVRARDILGDHLLQQLSKLTISLQFSEQLTKFDIILRDGEVFVIDMGLDPPNRLRALVEHHGHSFADLYVQGQIYRDWSQLLDLEDEILGSVAVVMRPGSPASVTLLG